MYTFNYKERFLKRLAKMLKKDRSIKSKIEKSLDILEKNPFYPSLKVHKVTLKYDGKEAFSIFVSGDIRIAWRFNQNSLEILDIEDIGAHSGKFQIYTKKSS